MKLSGVVGVKPLFLRMVPATTVAEAVEPVSAEKALWGELLDLPGAEDFVPAPVGHLLTTNSEDPTPPGGEDHAGTRNEAEEPFVAASQDEIPVFHRPSLRNGRDVSGGPVCGNLGDLPKSSRAVFPLPRDYFNSYEDTWGAARPQGGHEGSDLMSPAGTPEFAITDGDLVPVRRSNENGWNRLGGYTVMLQAAYDAGPIKKGDLFYYAHMDQKSALPIGTKVRAGQQIGVVGDTGEGREGTRGKFPPHLHLGWYDAGASASTGPRTNLQSGAMNPYPLLLWLEQNGGAVSGGTDASYCEAPQEPVPDSPSTSSDLDTGYENDARPSPIVGQSHDAHNHPPEQEPARENLSNENNAAGEPETFAATDSSPITESETEPGAGPAGRTEANDKSKGEGGETPTPDETEPAPEQVSPPSTGDDSPVVGDQEKVPLPAPSQADRTSRPSYTPILANAFDKDLQYGDKADKKKHKKKNKQNNKNPEPAARAEPKDERSKENRADAPDEAAESKDGASPSSAHQPEGKKTGGQRCASPRGGPDKGYDVHVTRARGQTDAQRTPIKYDEWLKAVEGDPEMRMQGAVKTTTGSGETLRYENEGLAVWTGHPVCREGWFDLRGGNIVVENTDELIIEKMREISATLNAKVQGHGGEEY